MNPRLLTLILIPWMIIVVMFVPVLKIINQPYNLFGIILFLIGAMLVLMALAWFIKHKTPPNPNEKPRKLVISGVYRYTRNPMYFGGLLIFIGLAVITGSLLAFLFPVIFFIIIDSKTIVREEKQLAKLFGEEYKKYKEKVRKWI